MHYRPEIDGLRAIAVLSVIFSHVGIDAFAGGFVGVDVFFVISGYLITSIILRDIEAGKFSLLHFYERRAKRILPALFFVLACSTVIFWFVLIPFDFKHYSISVIFATLSLSNLYFMLTRNYFAPDAADTPMIHTWSLAVEEQFYLLFPLIFILWRGRFVRSKMLVLGIVLSFALATVGIFYFPVINYYILPTRAWELLAGCLLARQLYGRRPVDNGFLALAGLLLIALSIVLYGNTTPFPSLYAAVPVLGAVLMIGFGTGSNIAGRWLSHPFAVVVGRLSFSAYLWHQPLLSMFRKYGWDFARYEVQVAVVLVTFSAAWFTHRFIEHPIRYMRLSLRQLTILVMICGAHLLASHALIAVNAGVPSRLPDKLAQFYDGLQFNKICLAEASEQSFAGRYGPCIHTGTKNKKIAVWGDSVASSLVPSIRGLKQFEGWDFLQFTNVSCVPAVTVHQAAPLCSQENSRIKDYLLRERVDVVVLAGSWVHQVEYWFEDVAGSPTEYAVIESGVVQDLRSTFEELEEIGTTVVTVLPYPVLHLSAPDRMARVIAANSGDLTVSIERDEFEVNLFAATTVLQKAAVSEGALVSPVEAFCDGSRCSLGDSGKSFLIDRTHYSRQGGDRIAKQIAQSLGTDTGASGDDDQQSLNSTH